MIELFSEEGRKRLDEIVQPGLLCAFDFDGTLAPIVAQPDTVQLPFEILQRLIHLSCYAPVAIITGRSIPDIRQYLGFDPDFVVGNHGLEGVPGWDNQAEKYQAMCRKWERQLQSALQDRHAFDPGVWIENKGYSLTAHYRPAQDHQRAEQDLTMLFAKLDPAPRIIAGKSAFNLLPLNATDKGMALAKLISGQGFRSALYVGDDVTDEDVFRLQRRDVLTIRIEPGADSAAEFFLPQRADMTALLDELIERLCMRKEKRDDARSA